MGGRQVLIKGARGYAPEKVSGRRGRRLRSPGTKGKKMTQGGCAVSSFQSKRKMVESDRPVCTPQCVTHLCRDPSAFFRPAETFLHFKSGYPTVKGTGTMGDWCQAMRTKPGPVSGPSKWRVQ